MSRVVSPVGKVAVLNTLVHGSVRHLCGPDPNGIPYSEEDLMVLCLVRDGISYVREFVGHYRSLGAKHIVFLDNGSSDGTVEALDSATEAGYVSVFSTLLPYKEYRHEMKQYMIERFGRRGRWVLVVDIDEFFDYPNSTAVGLGDFLRRLNGYRYTTVVCQMLDMFAKGPISRSEMDDSSPVTGGLRTVNRYYDLSGIQVGDYATHPWVRDNEISNPRIVVLRGGIRRQVFDANVTLTKHPLMFLDDKIRPIEDSAHWTNGASVADISCVLYHYKFLSGFHAIARKAAGDESYANASSEYKSYLKVLDREPELTLHRETAVELLGTGQLLASGFLTTSPDYDEWSYTYERRESRRLAEFSPEDLTERYMRLGREIRIGGRAATELRLRLYELSITAIRQREHLEQRSELLRKELEEMRSSRAWRLISRIENLIGRKRRG